MVHGIAYIYIDIMYIRSYIDGTIELYVEQYGGGWWNYLRSWGRWYVCMYVCLCVSIYVCVGGHVDMYMDIYVYLYVYV